MSRAYGWRASCPAGGVTAVGVGSGAWFGFFLFFIMKAVTNAKKRGIVIQINKSCQDDMM